jgi:hypothetical protein
MISVEVR